MPNKKISSRIQAVPKLFDQTLLFGFVEINHDIAAQDDVVTARQELGFQIVKIELHEFFELRLDLVLIAGFFKNSGAGRCNPRAPSAARCRDLPAQREDWHS